MKNTFNDIAILLALVIGAIFGSTVPSNQLVIADNVERYTCVGDDVKSVSNNENIVDKFIYTGKSVLRNDEDEAIAHAILTFVTFLEGRGEPYCGRDLINVSILNRITHRGFPKTAAAVSVSPGQYEPIVNDAAEVVKLMGNGDIQSGFTYLNERFDKVDMAKYVKIKKQSYKLIYDWDRVIDWPQVLYFYSPSLLKIRGVPVPTWVSNTTVVANIGKHIYMSDKI